MFSIVQFFYAILCQQALWIQSSTVNWLELAHEILARVILRSGVPWGLVKIWSHDLWFFWMRSSIVICTSGRVIWYAFLVPDYGLWSRSSIANLPKTIKNIYFSILLKWSWTPEFHAENKVLTPLGVPLAFPCNCLVVENMFLYFPNVGNNHPNWLSYVSKGLKPPTS